LVFGYDAGVLSSTLPEVAHFYSLSSSALGLTVSSGVGGMFCGSLFAGGIAERFGRRTCLQMVGALYAGSILACASAGAWSVFLSSRLCAGLGVGMLTTVCPMYLAEIAPVPRRGRIVGAFQLSISCGILAAFGLHLLLSSLVHKPAWRIEYFLAVIPVLLFLACLMFAVESLLVHAGSATESASYTSEWPWQRRYAKPLMLAVVLASLNQLSGVNPLLYYLKVTLESSQMSVFGSNQGLVAIAAINLLATAAALGLIDRFGRRPLLLVGSAGMAMAMGGIAALFIFGHAGRLIIPCIILFDIFFSMSQGAVFWVFLSEIFPLPVRARGQSVGSATHWGWNIALGAIFPVVFARWHAVPFIVFSSMMLLQGFLVATIFPETRGRQLWQVSS